MRKVLTFVLVMAIGALGEDALPSAPVPKTGDHLKAKIGVNVAMFGATYLTAYARAKGARDCRGEANRGGLPSTVGYRPGGNQTRFYTIAFSTDLAISLYSFLAHRKHWRGSFLAPAVTASSYLGAGAVTYAQGCT